MNATSAKAAPKTRHANKNKAAKRVRDKKKDNTMTEEIRQKSGKDWNDEEEDAAEKYVEIRPLPIPRNILLRYGSRQKQLSVSKPKTTNLKMQKATKKEENRDEDPNKKRRLTFFQEKKEALRKIENKNGSWLGQRRVNATSTKAAPKTRHANENKAAKQVKEKKKDNTLTDEEIRQKLEEDWNDEEEDGVEKDVEIRPLSIPRNVRQKQLSITETKTTKLEMVRQTTKKEEDSDEEPNKKRRLKIFEEKKEELCEIKDKYGSWEHQLLSDEDTSDDEDTSSEMNREVDTQNINQFNDVPTSVKNVSCPVCNKLFPHNEIEGHAAYCDQFETNNEKDDNNSDQLECYVCSKYKTTNGIEYEKHVHQCINKKMNGKS